MGTIIGIDLGTTNSLCAHMTDGGPQIVPNGLGDRMTPSMVGIDLEGHLLVGRPAKDLQILEPLRCTGLFKRHMGSDWTVTLAGRTFKPEELSSLVLRAIKQDAEDYLNEKIDRAVITVPAYFNDQQRKATIQAGMIAGLEVDRILNEPTAAALAYGFGASQQQKLLLIFDLGGGTFDVSVVETFEGMIEVRASAGESFLGGEDFTRSMAARILEQQGYPFERIELEAPRLVARMIQQCELAKCELSRAMTATVRVPNREGQFDTDAPVVRIERAMLESWTQHHLARVELPVRRALGDVRLDRSAIDETILVGGATRMPAVIARVTDMFGKPPHSRLNPDEVVALGAAVQAGLIGRHRSVEDLVVTDVCPFTLGIEVSKEFGTVRRTGYFMPIINRNTTIPVSRVEQVTTLSPNQQVIAVKIYQGESRKVDDNLLLGEFKVTDIPRGPAGQEVDIRFTYDINGVLEVEAKVVETGHSFTHLVTKFAKGLTPEQVAEAHAEMQKLKTHPREEMVNRFWLRRAERLYHELSLYERNHLSQLLDGFEAALDEADPDLIERHRAALTEFVEYFDGPRDGADDDDWRSNDD